MSPAIAVLSPDTGSTGGSTPLKITGSGFQPGAAVFIDGIAISAFVLDSRTIYACTPPHDARTGGRRRRQPRRPVGLADERLHLRVAADVRFQRRLDRRGGGRAPDGGAILRPGQRARQRFVRRVGTRSRSPPRRLSSTASSRSCEPTASGSRRESCRRPKRSARSTSSRARTPTGSRREPSGRPDQPSRRRILRVTMPRFFPRGGTRGLSCSNGRDGGGIAGDDRRYPAWPAGRPGAAGSREDRGAQRPRRAHAPAAGAWGAARMLQPLLVAERVRTLDASRASILFIDETQVKLNAGAVLTVREVQHGRAARPRRSSCSAARLVPHQESRAAA